MEMSEDKKMEMEDSEEEEGSELHPYDYKIRGNLEQLTSLPPLEAEEMEISINLDQQKSHLLKQDKVQATMTFLQQQKQYRIRVANLILRSAGVMLSLLSFVIMAFNDQRYDYLSYKDFEVYRYCLTMAIIAFVYVLFQLGKGIYDTFFRPNLFPNLVFCYIDLIGDQLLGYLLMSSSSTAASLTKLLGHTRFTKMAAASLSMSFIAFALVAVSSLLSAFALTKHTRW